MQYKVDILVNGKLYVRHVFRTRTKAQKYISEKYNAYTKVKQIFVSTHYTKWGKYKKPYNDMCIDSVNILTKKYNICIELNKL